MIFQPHRPPKWCFQENWWGVYTGILSSIHKIQMTWYEVCQIGQVQWYIATEKNTVIVTAISIHFLVSFLWPTDFYKVPFFNGHIVSRWLVGSWCFNQQTVGSSATQFSSPSPLYWKFVGHTHPSNLCTLEVCKSRQNWKKKKTFHISFKSIFLVLFKCLFNVNSCFLHFELHFLILTYGGFLKWWVFPQIIHLFIGFSIIFTIHLGVPQLLGNTHTISLELLLVNLRRNGVFSPRCQSAPKRRIPSSHVGLKVMGLRSSEVEGLSLMN